MSRKKRKTLHVEPDESTELPKRDLISSLPWELLAEILSSTSPKDILALARCSRHFCSSLVVNPHSKYIWEAARKSYNPPIPNPTPNFTEPAYAAYLFDGGPCKACQTFTNVYYMSYSLRLRFCKGDCYTSWRSSRENAVFVQDNPNDDIRRWLLCSESGLMDFRFSAGWYNLSLLDLNGRMQFASHAEPFYCTPDLEKAREEYRSFMRSARGFRPDKEKLYWHLHEKDEKRKKAILALSNELLLWSSQRSRIRKTVKTDNLKLLKKIAEQEGWNLDVVLNTPTCATLYKRFTDAHERLTEQDFNVAKAQVEAEVTKFIEKSARSREEQAYAERRKLVASDYHRRKSMGSSGQNLAVLPTLNVFRSQAVIRAMQNKQGTEPPDFSRRLNNPSVKAMIDDNLSVWMDQARNAFMKILGIKKYSTISTKKLHPVDRLTTRFVCSKCAQHASDDTRVSSLDFREACSHDCPHLTKKQKRRANWSPNQFQLDQKATDVTRRVLALLNVAEDDTGSLLVMDESGDRILCKSCSGKITMNFKTMQQHSHRHLHMDIEVLSATRATEFQSKPIQWGLCAELTSMAKSAPRKAELRIYGCRHCLKHEPSTQGPAPYDMTMDVDSVRSALLPSKPQEQQKLMSFHGMRCHVLKCHGIPYLGDEDIYRVDENAKPRTEHQTLSSDADSNH